MDSTKEPVTAKPLNCLYCSNAEIIPGSSSLNGFAYIPPIPGCTCYDVPHELIDLFEIKTCPNNKPHDNYFSDLYSWLPYHCGHFLPRLVKLRCAACLKPDVFEEWRLIQDVFIDCFNIMVCNQACKHVYLKGEKS